MQVSVLVETVDGRVHAFDALSGEKLWESETEGALVRTSITPQRSSDLSPKAAIVPGVDGQLYSIRLGSQAIQKLGVKASDVVQVSPNIAGDGSIVLGSKRDTVFVIHPLTGEVLSKITSDDLQSPAKVSEIFDKHFAKIVLEDSVGGVGSGQQSTQNLGLVNRKRGGREDVHTDGGLALPKVKGVEGKGVSAGEDVMDKLQPVLLSRTEYVIKAFNHKHNEELWNVSYTDCKQLSASEGLAMLGGEDPFKPDRDLSGDKLLNGPHMKQFSKLAETLRVFTTIDNTIRVANTRENMAQLWSEQLDSTPVSASLSDSISGHVHNIKLWSDESRGEEGNILVGIHTGGIFIMPNLKNDLRLGPGKEPDGGRGSNALAVPREIGSRLSSVMDVRGGGKSLMTFPLEDGSKDVQTMESLPAFFTNKKAKKEGEKKGNELDANALARKDPEGSKWTTFYMALMTLLIAVLFTFGGYLYEYYSNIENTQKRLREEMEKIEKMEKTEMQSPLSNRKKIANEEVMIGNLIVSPKILGYGSAGTIVFEGSLNHREVAVKRLLREFFHMAEKEIKALIVSDAHPSVLRCFAMEQDEEFIYLALERCQGTLHEFVNSQKFKKMVSGVVPLRMTSRQDVARNRGIVCQDFDVVRIVVPPVLLEMISDIGKAIRALHDMGIVHRDLKPQNVLLTSANKAKVSDMGLSKQLQAEQSSFDGTGMGSSGWQAPEVLLQKQQQLQRQSSLANLQDRPGSLKPVPEEESGGMNSSTSKGGDSNDSAECSTSGIRHTKAVDVFSFGCIIFYTLTRHHPFGDHIVQRDHNILNAKFDLKPMSMLRMYLGGDDGREADKWRRARAAEGPKELGSEESKDGDSDAAGDGPGDRKEGDAGEGANDEAAGEKGQGDTCQAEADGKERKPEVYVPTWRRKSREKVHPVSSRPRTADTLLRIAYISWYEANNLVYAMITKNPRERPKMKAVMAHPFWWDFERRVNFIVNLSHRMEKEDTVTNPALLRSLENYGNEVLNRRPWHKQIDKILWEESKQFRNYSVYSLRDLMRMIRNKVGHYRDNSDEVKEILGPVPNGVYTYFATTFPKLFMALYSFACKNLRSDPLLQRYFPDDVTPGDMVPFCMEETRPLDLYNDAGSAAELVKEDEEYPRRPGEPVCEYFVKSGWCRYCKTCRFDHPPEYKVGRNSIGYPLRPNQPECGHFARNGVCKFGAACKFSHPEKYLDPANREKHSAPSRDKHGSHRPRTSSR
ncbi:serine/threonine protein kinase [Chloropicon primus]|uniref:non-specific serine/threonine protein kinase n=1 Tax=Chloropicon primus TaxID=1764295 RepID=A0A5B8N0N6_9CHLO|nr:serine/threonine protein kinase [Chloropicon primus]|eukprot:QDZ26101.1 serine/threonine protein kinase [Chloropicon primus]